MPGFWGVAAALAALTLSACWWRLGSGEGSVTFSWFIQISSSLEANEFEDFNATCLASGVVQVEAQIGGRSATFDCDDFLDGGLSGTLDDIPAGPQAFTLTGFGPVFDGGNGGPTLQPLYGATGTLDIAEASTNQTPLIQLTPLSSVQSTGDVALLWTFDGQTCAQAGYPSVAINLDDGGALTTLPCQANGLDGVRLSTPQPTDQIFTLSTTIDGSPYQARPYANDNGITESVLHVDLFSPQETSGGGSSELAFDVGFGPDGGGCAASGVDQVHIVLIAQELGVFFNETFACDDPEAIVIAGTDGGIDYACGTAVCPLETGEYLVYAEGLSQGAVVFRLTGYPVWLDEGPTDGLGSDQGEVSTYPLDLPAVGAP